MLVSQVAIDEIETFLAIRRDTPIKRKDDDHPRSAATCNRELSALKRLINKALEWGMATTNPVPKVKPLPEPNGRTRFLSLDESRRLLECATRHLRPILLTALESSMRRGEIFRMKWDDVDLKRGTIFIGEAKIGHPRYVPISDRLKATLLKLPRRLGCDFVFSGESKIGQTGKPFIDVRTSFEKACMKAGIENFRFHDLRHTAASHMVMAGVDLKTVGDILGHRSITMTERYSHLTPEHKRKAVNLLPDWSAGEDDRSQNGRKTGKAGK
jgi:integrase